jgi:hypothetical protein
MRSPAVPLLWEIWRGSRGAIAAIAAATGLSWLIDLADSGSPPGPTPSAHNQLLGFLSFALVLAMFSHIESTGDNDGMGRFPRRLFTLPASTLQLVAVPVVTGVASIDLLYLVWMERLSGPNPTNPIFVAVLLGAFVVSYQAVLWTLERLGPLRLVLIGALAFVFLWIRFLPSIGESGPSAWRTERVLGSVVAGLAVAQFFWIWRFVSRIRSGGTRDGSLVGTRIRQLADVIPRRRRPFRSAESAHFWFEWRSSGSGYLAVVAGVLVLLLGPASVFTRDNSDSTVRLLMGALALPLVIAIPAGFAFSKPMFWSDQVSLPSFVAVRPLSDAELIAIKIKVAAVATVIAWLLVFGFLSLWLTLWADQSIVHRVVTQSRAVGGDWWLGIAGLVVLSAMFVSWRFLVAGLWAGMSGSSALFKALFAPIVIAVVVSAIFDVRQIPGWITEDLRRLVPFLWAGTVAVAIKFWMTARELRRTSSSWARPYVGGSLIGAASLVGLGAVVLSKVGQNVPDGDARRIWAALILFAVLLMPMARLVWAPRFVGLNRHRR